MKKISCFLLVCVMVSGLLYGCGEADTETGSAAPAESVTGSAEASETAGLTESLRTVTALVHLRSGPDILSESLGLIEPGSSVTLLSEEGIWGMVRFGNLTGYVPSEYLAAAEETASETAETTSGNSAESTLSSEDTASVPSSEETSAASAASESTVSIDPDGGVLTDLGLFDLTGLSNTSVPYGNDWEDKDAATGLANGIFWYESVYGKYNGVYRIRTSEKIIYLTMDEGYEAGYTPKILDILKEKNVKAVFFITKQFLDSDPELVQRMIDEGHIIGNHTCNHPSGGYPKAVDENGLQYFTDDVAKLHRLVYDRFGYTMKLFRFPEGESSELTLAALNNLGYTPVFWSYAHRDFDLSDQPEVSVTLERCLSHLACGSVYLLHAVSESNTEALADFIDQARAQGYEFGVFPVDEVCAR